MPGSIQTDKRRRLAALAAAGLPADAAKPEVSVTDVTAVAVEEPVGKRRSVIVLVETDAGVTGVAEAAAGGDARATAERIAAAKEHLAGRDALAAEATRHALARALGDAAAAVAGAVHTALLDAAGKLAKAPVYALLGGPTREKARGMAQLDGDGEAVLAASLERARGRGFRAFLVPLPAALAGPTLAVRARRLLEGLRRRAGDDSDFVLDCGGRLRPGEAVALARELQSFHALWLEEPCGAVPGPALRKITEETVTPIGTGRTLRHNRGFQDLLREDALDVARPDVALLGIGEARKTAALAETYYVAVAPYHRGGPIATAAALQLAASIPNFFIQEVPAPADERDVAMRLELAGAGLEDPVDGFLPLPSGPGLGVTLDPEALDEYRVPE